VSATVSDRVRQNMHFKWAAEGIKRGCGWSLRRRSMRCVQLDEAAGAIDVDDVAVTHVGGQEIVAVTLVHVDPPDERLLVGAALARQSPDIAAVRAVLDAVNRRLPYLPAGPSLR
jgi:hypothetical protein